MSGEFDLIERDRGILTQRDREIMTGQHDDELTNNALNQRFYNIRNRVENSIYDFYLLARYLPLPDIRQVFEPSYEWARQRRQLDRQGRNVTQPQLSMFLRSWLSLFEFYSYGMYASRMDETEGLMRGLVTEGIERGYRSYQRENKKVFQEVAVSLNIDYGNQILWRNYLLQLQNELPNDPTEIAEQVIRWDRERRIPHNIAQQWIEEFVRRPEY
ncbi:hypothetical protein ACFQH6_17575 [Halobacteriaceae archaeon GCM10025711]